jgi:hypothetical protein
VEENREAARQFLIGLQNHLRDEIPSDAVRNWIKETSSAAQKGKNTQFESLFLDN